MVQSVLRLAGLVLGPMVNLQTRKTVLGDGPQPALPLRLLTTCRQEVLPHTAGSPHVNRLSTGLADRPPGRTTMVSSVSVLIL